MKHLALTTTAALLLLPSIGHAAASCAEIQARHPGARDDTYRLRLGPHKVEVYCHDMAGTPREYLTLPKTGQTTNYSYYGRGPNTAPAGLTTWYQKVRFNPADLTLDLSDTTFAIRQGWASFGPTRIESVPLASAGDCVANDSRTGRSNIDLTGTPFGIEPGQFQTSGFNPSGTATSKGSQIVNLRGGGYCGNIGAPDNLLQLTFRTAPPRGPHGRQRTQPRG
ncbi:GON domain-containing protein [Myxococcus fulvus]|uniref:GON domain-containing protein n=1 Tax=Myxococcus fulvus TaxID=33 RepID=UPI003B9A16D0